MRVLIDTQIFLWSVLEPERIRPKIRKIINTSEVYLSSVSCFEIQLKRTINKLNIEPDFSFFTDQEILNELPFTIDHAVRTHALPLIHRDPFDRMLIAQSMVEDMPLITADRHIQQYNFRFISA